MAIIYIYRYIYIYIYVSMFMYILYYIINAHMLKHIKLFPFYLYDIQALVSW